MRIVVVVIFFDEKIYCSYVVYLPHDLTAYQQISEYYIKTSLISSIGRTSYNCICNPGMACAAKFHYDSLSWILSQIVICLSPHVL